MTAATIIPAERAESRIFLIRGHRVILDADLASMYGVPTKALLQAVRRNKSRFPIDFMFQLTSLESDSLRSKTVTSKRGRGGRRYLPYVFTEQGVAMLSSVLHSSRAIQVNIAIMRASVRLREMVAFNREFDGKLKELEGRIGTHDSHIRTIFEALRRLMKPPERPHRRIGF